MLDKLSTAEVRHDPPRPTGDGGLDFADAYREFKRRVDLSSLGLDPDALNEDARDQTPGRDVRL